MNIENHRKLPNKHFVDNEESAQSNWSVLQISSCGWGDYRFLLKFRSNGSPRTLDKMHGFYGAILKNFFTSFVFRNLPQIDAIMDLSRLKAPAVPSFSPHFSVLVLHLKFPLVFSFCL